MLQTVGDLKEFLLNCNVPDDAILWMEYPEQLAQPGVKEFIEVKTKDGHVVEDHVVIESMSMAYDIKNNRFYILHHF